MFQTIENQRWQKPECARGGLLLCVLVGAVGPVTEATAKPCNKQILGYASFQVQVRAAFCKGIFVLWVINRVMITGHVQERSAQYGYQIFQIGVGQITTAKDEIYARKMPIGGERIYAFNYLVTYSEYLDHNPCIVPYKSEPGKY
jgi:hypothetical protein